MTEKSLGQALDLLDKIGTYDNVGPERMDALELVTETLRAYLPVVEAAEEYARSWKSNFEWGHTAAKRDRMFAAVEALQKERE